MSNYENMLTRLKNFECETVEGRIAQHKFMIELEKEYRLFQYQDVLNRLDIGEIRKCIRNLRALANESFYECKEELRKLLKGITPEIMNDYLSESEILELGFYNNYEDKNVNRLVVRLCSHYN